MRVRSCFRDRYDFRSSFSFPPERLVFSMSVTRTLAAAKKFLNALPPLIRSGGRFAFTAPEEQFV
jgi:hypothetical protein